MLNQTIEVTIVCRKALVSQCLHTISHFGFKKMFDSFDVPTFWRHTTFGDGKILSEANIELKWSP